MLAGTAQRVANPGLLESPPAGAQGRSHGRTKPEFRGDIWIKGLWLLPEPLAGEQGNLWVRLRSRVAPGLSAMSARNGCKGKMFVAVSSLGRRGIAPAAPSFSSALRPLHSFPCTNLSTLSSRFLHSVTGGLQMNLAAPATFRHYLVLFHSVGITFGVGPGVDFLHVRL